jgi:hypothetical protein
MAEEQGNEWTFVELKTTDEKGHEIVLPEPVMIVANPDALKKSDLPAKRPAPRRKAKRSASKLRRVK